MMILRAILFSIEAICSVLLIGIILMQKAKGGGLGVAFGSGVSENLFGSRTGNVLTKATVILAVIFMVNTVALAILFARTHDRTLMDSHMPPPRPATEQHQPMPREQLPAVPDADMQMQPTAPVPTTEQPEPVPAVELPTTFDGDIPVITPSDPVEE